ncbi:MAG: hypothetical protein ACYCYO_20805 [Bacilli bacterium]
MLRLLDVAEAKNIRRDFEYMGTGLILLRVTSEDKIPSPYHWMLEDGRKPGLDISFNPTNGNMVYMKFFLQDEKVKVESVEISATELQGLPLFDKSDWNENQYYLSEHGAVKLMFDGTNLYLIRTGHTPTICVRTGQSFSMLFSTDKIFSGAMFHDVNTEEIQLLKDAGML